MKITVGRLRQIFQEAGKISAHPSYMKKEKVREDMQKLIIARVAAGEITTQEELDGCINDVNLSLTALKMIPLTVWQKMAGT